ncbi:DNA dC-_dU-editing enzyme APOBEC-3A-like [Ochotona curzoniae]|uniref:DNA dC->dU-editing enzyme APOBEC-3A-like n=1 Tax=Ochotona curzoniae TaxID=130825 RepID=UPI001B34FABC|nr:DNA dC->dU-editing enzyme APOBEC-3A-like [Ochotona curzoniae]
MDDSIAPRPRVLMEPEMFKQQFANEDQGCGLRQTYLCYEVERWDGSSWVPMAEHQGFLRNQPRSRHAELCFLDLLSHWQLDPAQRYRITWFISWSPCSDCAEHVVTFLGNSNHVNLRIFAARIYTLSRYQEGLQALQKAGAPAAIMSLDEFAYCWNTFVDNQNCPFEPSPGLANAIQCREEGLQHILQPSRVSLFGSSRPGDAHPSWTAQRAQVPACSAQGGGPEPGGCSGRRPQGAHGDRTRRRCFPSAP